jgi:hypothetical protein
MKRDRELKALGLLPGFFAWGIASVFFTNPMLPIMLGGLIISITELGIATLLYLNPPNDKQ